MHNSPASNIPLNPSKRYLRIAAGAFSRDHAIPPLLLSHSWEFLIVKSIKGFAHWITVATEERTLEARDSLIHLHQANSLSDG